jgi:hypothetical protein
VADAATSLSAVEEVAVVALTAVSVVEGGSVVDVAGDVSAKLVAVVGPDPAGSAAEATPAITRATRTSGRQTKICARGCGAAIRGPPTSKQPRRLALVADIIDLACGDVSAEKGVIGQLSLNGQLSLSGLKRPVGGTHRAMDGHADPFVCERSPGNRRSRAAGLVAFERPTTLRSARALTPDITAPMTATGIVVRRRAHRCSASGAPGTTGKARSRCRGVCSSTVRLSADADVPAAAYQERGQLN